MRFLRWVVATLALAYLSLTAQGASNGSVTTEAGKSWTTVYSVDLNEELAKIFATPVLTIGNQTIWSTERGLAVAGCVSGTDGGAGSSYTIGLVSACIDAALLATDSVSADELNATGVESELEAVIDLQDLQGAVTAGQLTAIDTSAELRALLTDETGGGALYFAGGNAGTPSAIVLTNGTSLPISTGVSGFATGMATFLATPSSANFASTLTDETGTGANVFANSPTLVTPALGTPSSATLTNATGLPISTGVSGLGTGVATFLATPSSANFASAITNETGTGNVVLATSPALTTPDLGTPSAATLTNATGLPISTGVSGLGSGVGTFLATPSTGNFAAAVTGETGSGAVVFGTSPTITSPTIDGTVAGTGVATGATASKLVLRDANANSAANAFLKGYTTTATAAGTTTLTVASTELQFFTGSTTQTVTMPVVSTLVLGQTWWIVNQSSGAVAVNSSGSNLILSVAAGNTGIFTVVSTSGTSAASWQATYISSGAGTGTVTSVTCGAGLSGGTITTTGSCALDINGLSADSAPDTAADYVASYDASATGLKKVLMNVLLAQKPEAWCFPLSDENVTALTTGTAKYTFRWPYAFTITGVSLQVTTDSSSGLPTVDINEAGSTILSTKLTIDAGEKTSATAVTAAVISDNTFAADAEITFDQDVAGTGAKGEKVCITGHQ